MKIRKIPGGDTKVELQMTPMIDIVFQLLVFFIMSFKLASPEADFNIKMPLASAAAEGIDENLLPPLKLYLTADSRGELQLPFVLNEDRSFDSFEALTEYIAGLLGDDTSEGSLRESAEVELHCDYNLRYAYVVKAIDAVSGKVNREDNSIIKLVEKIQFAPQPERGN